jgi:hypothetical protein
VKLTSTLNIIPSSLPPIHLNRITQIEERLKAMKKEEPEQ